MELKSNKKNLNGFFIHFLSENISKFDLDKYTIFMCRADGVPLFFHNTEVNKQNEATIGALLGGAWQAANALSSFIKNANQSKEFRLSFDTSESGIYALPIYVNSSEYYLGIIYSNENSPGKIKSKMRLIADKMEGQAKCVTCNTSNTQHSDNKGEYLFKDISDNEIDKIFSFVRN